jgi:hypothetical protein
MKPQLRISYTTAVEMIVNSLPDLYQYVPVILYFRYSNPIFQLQYTSHNKVKFSLSRIKRHVRGVVV